MQMEKNQFLMPFQFFTDRYQTSLRARASSGLPLHITALNIIRKE